MGKVSYSSFCTLVVIAAVLCVAQVSVDSAEICNSSELIPCINAMNSSTAPSKTCCQRLKAQGPSCLCAYLRDKKLGPYFKSPGAKKFASACNVLIPNC